MPPFFHLLLRWLHEREWPEASWVCVSGTSMGALAVGREAIFISVLLGGRAMDELNEMESGCSPFEVMAPASRLTALIFCSAHLAHDCGLPCDTSYMLFHSCPICVVPSAFCRQPGRS